MVSRAALLALVASMVASPACARAPIADTVLLHGRLFTAEPSQAWAQALAIRNGRIDAVGSDARIARRIGPGTVVVDLHGGIVLPGLIDSHVHPVGGGRQLEEATLDGKPVSLAEFHRFFDQALASGRAEYKGVTIITGVHANLWSENLSALLDAPPYAGRPILLCGWDGHTGWASKALLARFGLSDAASLASLPEAERADFQQDGHGGLTGFATERGLSRLKIVFPGHDGVMSLQWLRDGQRYLNSHGVTGVLEANASYIPEDGEATLPLYRALAWNGDLTLRVSALLEAKDQSDLPRILAMRAAFPPLPGFAIKGVKVYVDGDIEYPSQGAALIEPYANSGKFGQLHLTAPELAAILGKANAQGLFVHMHTVGDRAVRTGLDAITLARQTDPTHSLTNSLAHLQVVAKDDVARFAATGTMASFQLLWAMDDDTESKLTRPYVSAGTYARQYPVRVIWQAGGHFAGGSDWPVTSGDPFAAIATAMTRRGPHGVLNPDQTMPLAPMIRAYTLEAARLIGRADEIGSLRAGKLADMILIDRNPWSISPEALARTRVLWTMVGGRVVYRAP